MGVEWPHAGVKLPSDVQEALARDSLVIFCGAGVSIPSPSNLPSFIGLAQQIAQAVDPSIDTSRIDEKTQLDVLFGQLDEVGGNVHVRVENLLRPSLEPNSLHRSLVNLSLSCTTRIVTTNFDLHFERALAELGIVQPTYTAPALPRGNDFRGVVHVHGRIPMAPSERIVLSDRDFGLAYITEGWATEFLTALFANYTVLFVGYSAHDTVMRYLARALPGGDDSRKLFALTPERSAETWSSLPVKPIMYPQPRGEHDHESLDTFLKGWADRENWTAVEKFDTVQNLMAEGPAGGTMSDEEIKWILSDAELSRIFLSNPPTIEWFKWMETNSLLDKLFEPGLLDNDDDALLALWVSQTIKVDHGRALVNSIASRGGHVSHHLWVYAYIALDSDYLPGPPSSQLAMMLASASEVLEVGRLSGLVATISKRDARTGEALFRRLLNLQNVFKLGWMWQTNGTAQMELRGAWNDYSMRAAWAELLPQLSDSGQMVEHLVGLLAAAESEGSNFSGRSEIDSISIVRSAIGEEGSYASDSAVDFIIDILRDLLCSEVESDGIGRTVDLIGRHSEVLRRIAVYALSRAREEFVDPALKLLIDDSLVFEWRYKPEIFLVLSTKYGLGSDRVRHEVCDHIEKFVRANDGPEISDKWRYDLLQSIVSNWPDDLIAREALDRASASDPKFTPDPHAAQNLWFDVGASQSVPATTGRFLGMTRSAVARDLAKDSSLSDVLDSQETLAEVERYLKGSRTRDRFLSALADNEVWSPPLWNSIIHSESTRTHGMNLEKIFGQVLRRPTVAPLASSLRWIFAPAGNQLDSASVDDIELRQRQLFAIWRRLRTELDAHESPPSVDWAVNTPIGILVGAYLDLLTRARLLRRRRSLPRIDKSELTEMVASSLNENDPTVLILMRYAKNIQYFDRIWFEENIEPLVEFDSLSSARVWEGLLTTLGWSPLMIDRLRSRVQSAFPFIQRELPASTDRFLEVHSFLYFPATGSPDPEWADSLFLNSSDAERAQWIRHFGALHSRFPDSYSSEALLGYWSRRIHTGLPQLISAHEQAAFLNWIRAKTLDFERVVELFVAGPLISSSRDQPYFHVDFTNLPLDAHPEAASSLMLHIVEGSPSLPDHVRLMADHAVDRVAAVNKSLAVELLSALLKRGFTPARPMIDEVNAR